MPNDAKPISGQIDNRTVRQGGKTLANRVVARVSHVHGSVTVHRHPFRIVKTGRAAGAVRVSRTAGGSSECRYNSGRGNLSDCVTGWIPHVNIAAPVQRHAERIAKP